MKLPEICSALHRFRRAGVGYSPHRELYFHCSGVTCRSTFVLVHVLHSCGSLKGRILQGCGLPLRSPKAYYLLAKTAASGLRRIRIKQICDGLSVSRLKCVSVSTRHGSGGKCFPPYRAYFYIRCECLGPKKMMVNGAAGDAFGENPMLPWQRAGE